MKKMFYIFICFVFFVNPGFSQNGTSKPIVIKANYFDVSPPLRDMVQDVNAKIDMSWKDGVVKNKMNAQGNDNDISDPYFEDPIKQTFFGQVVTDTTLQNFDGVPMSGYWPPDTDGDVGPNHYFQVVNVRFAIYDKDGTKLIGPLNNSTIFQGLPHNNNDGDAVVLYDENADRWLFSQFSLPNYPYGPFYENVAISTTPDPTGTWNRYQYTFTDMPDYPKLSVWGDGYYMTIRRFASGTGSWISPSAVAMERTKMLAGDPAPNMVMFNLPSSCDGPLPADCDSDFPPDTTPCPVCYLVKGSSASIKVNNFHVDWTTTSNSSFTLAGTISISPFTAWNYESIVPQKGTSQKLDVFSRKVVMFRMPFRKFDDHWSMLLNTTVNASSIAGIRWMEIRNTGSGWSLYQEGTYNPDANFRWMGSIAMDSVGNIALGFSISSSNMYPSIRYTGRMNGDPLGVMTIAERGIFNGAGSQTSSDGRWGDYSAMAADPSTPGKFWYTQEYYTSTSQANWKTRIASFSFANVMTVDATATPDLICHAGDSSQLNVVATGGSGTFTYSWTSIPAGFVSDIQNPVVHPTETTQYVATVNDGTQTKNDTVTVTLQSLPIVNAGPDTSYCWWVSLFPISGTAENYSQIKWKTAGDGHFNFNNMLDAVYYPGDVDRTSGSVTLSLVGYSLAPCNDSISDDLFVDLVCTGIPQPESDKFAVSLQPNPSSGVFYINVSGVRDQAVNVSVIDLQGKTVYKDATKNGSNVLIRKIDLSSLSKGTYVIKVQTEKDQKIDKIIIQ
jgi:hypothetical protein